MIDAFRVIQAQVNFEKNGTFLDLKEFCSSFSIDYGDVSGAGTQANDGIAAVAQIVMKNDIDNNFNPLDQTSKWNKYGGAYEPLLWENRNVSIRANAFTTTYITEIITGNGSNIYMSKNKNILPNTVTVKKVYGIAPLMSNLGSLTFNSTYLGQQLKTYSFNGIYEKNKSGSDMYSINALNKILSFNDLVGSTFNSLYYGKVLKLYTFEGLDTSQYFNFGEVVPSGVILDVQYLVKNGTDLITLFDGVLGDDISPSRHQVSLSSRDKTKVLMDCIIDATKLRTYTATGTATAPIYTDSVTSIAYNDGVPIEVYIQNLLDDMLGVGVIPLNATTSPLYAIKPANDILQYQTLWSAINGVVTSIGWYIGFRYVNELTGYVLTLLEPDRAKTTADFAFTHTDDIYTAQGKLDFSAIRNKIVVRYVDKNGEQQEIARTDTASINNYGERLLVIEADKTQGLTTSTEAGYLGDRILSDLKDARIYTQIEMPFSPQIQPFSTFTLSYPQLSSTVDFYAVESVRHEFDFEGNRYRTTLNCNKSVTGGLGRWQKIAARPGAYQPVTANKLTEAYSYLPPTGLIVAGTAIVFSDTTISVSASVSFTKPIVDNPSNYELQYKKNTDGWDNANKVIAKDTKFNIILTDSVQYDFRVASLAKNGDRGDWSSIVNFTPTPSAYEITDADLSGLRDNTLYIKTQSQMDLWLTNVCNVTAYAPDYSRVVICPKPDGTAYECGTTLTPLKAININSVSFSLEGRGMPVINWYGETNGKIVKTNAKNFSLIGLSLNVYASPTYFNFIVEISRPSISNDPINYSLKDNNIICTSGKVDLFYNSGSDLTNSVFHIERNNFYISRMGLYSWTGYIDSVYIQNNKMTFINFGMTVLSVTRAKNVFFENNNVTSQIEGQVLYFNLVDYVFVYNNTLVCSNTPLTNDYYIFIESVSKCYKIFKNTVIFNSNRGNAAGTLPKFVASPYDLTAFIVSENSCQDNYTNWIDIYGGVVSITSGTNTLTKAGATFQTDLKIGQKIIVAGQIRTILTIPSQTSLTVDANWSANATNVTAYFEKATIQTWLVGGTGSKNNLVINNINDSY